MTDTRTLEVTLRIVVSDLSDEERREEAKIAAFGDTDPEEAAEEMPRIADAEPDDIAEVLTFLENDLDAQRELFGGSNLFAKFTSIDLVSAKWSDA